MVTKEETVDTQGSTLGSNGRANPDEFAKHAAALSKKFSDERTGEYLLNLRVEEQRTILGGIIPEIGIGALAGPSDSGKTALLRQLAISIVTGADRFLSWDLKTRHRSAVYVSTEDDQTAVAYLLNRMNGDLQLKPEELHNLRYIFDTDNIISKINRSLTKKKADMVILDCFSDLYDRSLNEANQVRTYLNEFSQLAQKHETFVLFLHHVGKRKEEMEPSKHNLLGSQGFESKMRLVMELRKDHTDLFKRHLCLVKGNYLPESMKQESFVLHFNQNLIFSDTGERVPFEELTIDTRQSKIDRVAQLLSEKKTQKEIESVTGINQSTISRWKNQGKV